MISTEKPGTPAELAHHGVKGMKWGVRKAYTERRSDEASTLRRFSKSPSGLSGLKPSRLRDAAVVDKHIGPFTAISKGGYRPAAAAKADEYQKHVDRINRGKATTKDKLLMYGNLSLADIAKGAAYSRTKK